MHVAATPLGSTATSIAVKVAVAGVGDAGPVGLALAVADEVTVLSGWRFLGAGEQRIWYTTQHRGDLAPGVTHDVEVRADGEVVAHAASATLPAVGRPVGLIIGSCFDGDQPRSAVRTAYDELAERLAQRSATRLNLWFGDQVYLDAPWQRTVFPIDPERTILAKYRTAWGLRAPTSVDHPDDGLAYAMSRSANWFLPDDHEFWNGYPHPSFFTLPFHTAGRIAVQIMRWFLTGPDRPSHPHAQGRWGRMAGEAYCAFQTDLDFERFGEDVNPPQLQQIDVGNALIVMADTRWHRTIRKTGPRSGFMLDADLGTLIGILRSEQRLVGLCLSHPVAGYLPDRGPVRDKIVYAPQDYYRQYLPLWEALNDRAAAGLPTLVLGGDKHAQSVTAVLDGRLLEVVSSPLGLLVALDSNIVTTLRNGWRMAKGRLRALIDRLRHRRPAPPAAYPLVHDDGSWDPAVGRIIVAEQHTVSGAVSITIDTADAERPALIIDLVRTDTGRPELTCRRFAWDGRWVGVDEPAPIR